MSTAKKVQSFIKKYKFSLLSFIFFYIALFSKDANLLSLFTLANILSILLIVNIFSKLKYSFVLLLLLIIACTVDSFFAFYYKDHILFGILASILETNLFEATGMSKALLPIWLSIFAIIFILLFFAKKELKEVKLEIKKSLLILASYFIVLALSFAISIYADTKYYSEARVNIFAPISELAKKRTPLLYYTLPDLASYYNEMREYKQYKTDVRILPEGVTFNNEKAKLEKVYIVLGESSSSKYFSLYGYNKNTTPFLDSLQQMNPSPLFAYKGLSPAALTREAVRLTLSYTAANHLDNFYKYKNIIELANDAAYETNWLSNQYRGGLYDTYIAMIAKDANYSRFEINPSEDFSLVKVMQELLKEDKKQFFVLHTTGSHMPYSNGADSLDIIKLPGKDIESQYIKTIHHVDRLLEKVYNIIINDTVPSALFYYSDHGEILGKGHGFVNNVSTEEMHDQFSVPIIAIMNNAAKDIVTKTTFDKFYDTEIQKISTQNIINIISESIGYNLGDNFVRQSIENGRYIYHVDTKCYYYKDLLEGNK